MSNAGHAGRPVDAAPRILPAHISDMQKDIDMLNDAVSRLQVLSNRAIGHLPPSDPQLAPNTADRPMSIPEQLHALHVSIQDGTTHLNKLITHLEQLV